MSGRASAHLLDLQRQAGNRAVVELLRHRTPGPPVSRALIQREPAGGRENPAVTSTSPPGTLTEEQWAKAYRAAVAKPSVEAYEPLFRDIAITAGMAALGAGFVPRVVPVTDGKTAKPGLNMTLNTADEPGHTAWIDGNGAFGVGMDLRAKAPGDLTIAVVLAPHALNADKGISLATVRHEMVHARHKLKVLASVKAWLKHGRPANFEKWLRTQARNKATAMSSVDVALVSKGVHNAQADTEVLAYVEGFVHEFHRRPATLDQAGPAFFQLLGAVETRKIYTWAQADPAVRAEALDRLRAYHKQLDPDHQRLWKEWLDRQIPRVVNDRTGRKEFLGALTAFVS